MSEKGSTAMATFGSLAFGEGRETASFAAAGPFFAAFSGLTPGTTLTSSPALTRPSMKCSSSSESKYFPISSRAVAAKSGRIRSSSFRAFPADSISPSWPKAAAWLAGPQKYPGMLILDAASMAAR